MELSFNESAIYPRVTIPEEDQSSQFSKTNQTPKDVSPLKKAGSSKDCQFTIRISSVQNSSGYIACLDIQFSLIPVE